MKDLSRHVIYQDICVAHMHIFLNAQVIRESHGVIHGWLGRRCGWILWTDVNNTSNGSKHLMSIYHVPETVLRAHIILLKVLYYSLSS